MKINIIPKPKEMNYKYSEYFVVNELTQIKNLNSSFLFNKLASIFPNIDEEDGTNVINFEQKEELKSEAYKIYIRENNITIQYKDYSSQFYAIETLSQLVEFNKDILNSIEIFDEPEFSHRQFVVDSVRHFLPINEIKRIIDIMGVYKINCMHWHLTDDSGWRIEIPKYERLTSVGSIRNKSLSEHVFLNQEYPASGFYTHAELIEIVEYAKERAINILPEFSMPGHISALLAAYPQCGCNEEYSVSERNGIHKNLLCVGSDEAIKIILDIYDEISNIFPFKYIHIGGDEVLHEEWLKCDKCRKKMEELGFEKTSELQTYMSNIVIDHLHSKGKTALLWNEAMLDKNLRGDVPFLYWAPYTQTKEQLEDIIKRGHKVIDVTEECLYLDHPNGKSSLRDIYEYVSIFDETNMIGMGGAIWTEIIPNRQQFDKMVFPRLLALSEIMWINHREKDFIEFINRLEMHDQILGKYGVKNRRKVINKVANWQELVDKMVERWNGVDRDRQIS